MDIEDIAETMKARMPWDTGRRVLDSGGIEKARGWENTVRKLAEKSGDDGEAIAFLSSALKGHILCGEKLTRFYQLSKKDMARLRAAAADLQPRNTEFRKAYPAKVSEQKIEDTFPQKHALVAVERNEDGIGVVFASTRAIQIRQPIDLADLPDEAAAALDSFDEVLGVKLQKFQAMDVLWFPHGGTFIDVRVDFPRGMHLDTGSAAHEATKNAFAQLIGEDHLLNPVNLFPLIKKIYDDPNEGKIVELAFGTTTASLKHERMRRGNSCLRKEKYHRGGKQALNAPIEPYRLSVKWKVQVDDNIVSHPELSLNGSSRMTGSANPIIHDVSVRGCVGSVDYEHVRERIEHFLKS